ADPALAEKKRAQAKSARYVQLCRSEDGINTMIVRADQGDLIMVYALADILQLEGSTEPADERRATAFGLLAQPAMILAMLLRHKDDGTQPSSTAGSSAPDTMASATGRDTKPASTAETAISDPGTPDPHPADEGVVDAATVGDLDRDDERGSRPDCADAGDQTDNEPPPPDPRADPPAWTADDYDEPPDPAPIDHPNIPDYWQQRLRPRPAPEPPAPGWHQEPDDPDPPDRSGLRLDLPGLTDLLTQQGLRSARPRVVLNIHLTDHTLATGTGVVRTDHPDLGPILAAQLREFLTNPSCAITVRPVLDLDRIPAVDAYEIPAVVRDAVPLRHIASVFPYSSATHPSMDLDHTSPYRWDGTPGQTGPSNLGPLTRGEHNAKTHGLWTVTSPHPGVFLWRSPHGHWFLSTNHGTQHLGPLPDTGCPAIELAASHSS
ncbi:MAG TPA: hypothetical protein VIT65_00365, partial [Microlunatus sp.]